MERKIGQMRSGLGGFSSCLFLRLQASFVVRHRGWFCPKGQTRLIHSVVVFVNNRVNRRPSFILCYARSECAPTEQ
ncbi:hypothetical protein GQ53DRAFT_177282 [Thozetella sp. PMI_491]|nr:hypothetical protein GQ53DRAFT_177282 [Thozetella sp. PMI_491]